MTAVGTILALAALLLATIWLFQRRLIYFPFGDVPPVYSMTR